MSANDEIRRQLSHGMAGKREEMQFRIVRTPESESDHAKWVRVLRSLGMTPLMESQGWPNNDG